MGERAGTELQITAFRDDLSGTKMRIALDANIHLSLRHKPRPLADPVSFSGASSEASDTPVTFGVSPLNEPLTPNEDDLLELSPVSGTDMMLRSRPTLAVIVSPSTTASFRLVSRPDSILILPDPVTWLLTCVVPLLFDLPEPPFAPPLQPPVALPSPIPTE